MADKQHMSSSSQSMQMCRTLVEAAIAAPSSDNMQPWQFFIDEEHSSIAIYIDKSRGHSLLDPQYHMSRMSVGAALENMIKTATHNGWHIEVNPKPAPAEALVGVSGSINKDPEVDPIVKARATNRRRYESKEIDAELRRRLETSSLLEEGARHIWIYDRERIKKIATVLSKADALLYNEPSFLRSFTTLVRFPTPIDSSRIEMHDDFYSHTGLASETLGVGFMQQLGLRLIGLVPNWGLRLLRNGWLFARQTKRLIRSSQGIVIVVGRNHTQAGDIMLGRNVQRTWFALTQEGLASQPMMTLVVLQHLLKYQEVSFASQAYQKTLERLQAEFTDLLPELKGSEAGFLLRFGYAAPMPVSARMPVDSFILQEPPTMD